MFKAFAKAMGSPLNFIRPGASAPRDGRPAPGGVSQRYTKGHTLTISGDALDRQPGGSNPIG